MIRSINLLPRIPFAKQYYGLLMGTVAAVTVAGCAGMIYYHVHTSQNVQAKDELKAKLESQVAVLRKERIVDTRSAQYQAFVKDLDKVKAARKDWLPVFQVLTSQLPVTSRIQTMSSDAKGKVKLELQMKTLEDVSGYIVLLQKSSLFQTVTAQSIKATSFVPSAPDNKTVISSSIGSGSAWPTAGSFSTGGASAGSGESSAVTTDQYLQLFNKPSGANTNPTESDQLLEELDWMVNNQLSQQLHGIPVPKATPAPTSGPAAPSGGPITQQDVEIARKKLEALKKVTVTESAATNAPAGGAAVPTTTPAQPSTQLYSVVLELQCKP
ncbi:PilN domain-containing protein [Gorillibacterium sp. sgz5001074]|uniref:PilN domain-containing protein n=1 Tax=Gorillibacterium sp. sgz5001074 TaxID=3446695 RepID=UPI003F670DD0